MAKKQIEIEIDKKALKKVLKVFAIIIILLTLGINGYSIYTSNVESKKHDEILELKEKLNAKSTYFKKVEKKYLLSKSVDKIDSINKEKKNIKGENDEVVKQLKTFINQMEEIYEDNHLYINKKVTNKFIKLNDKMKNGDISKKKLKNVKKFVDTYYKDIIRYNQCSELYDDSKSETCKDLISSISLLKKIEKNNKNYNSILKKDKAEKKAKKREQEKQQQTVIQENPQHSIDPKKKQTKKPTPKKEKVKKCSTTLNTTSFFNTRAGAEAELARYRNANCSGGKVITVVVNGKTMYKCSY